MATTTTTTTTTTSKVKATMVVKDIVEMAIEDKLDNNQFPFLGGQRQNSNRGAAPTSARYGGWAGGQKNQSAAKTSPRIIAFVAGGTTYSEMRAAYEVTSDKKNWEIVMGKYQIYIYIKKTVLFVMLGGSHIMTPEEFLESVKEVTGGDDEE